MFWYLNKQSDTAEIFGSISAIIKHDSLQKTEYPNKLYRSFSRLKNLIFEDEKYRIEKKDVIKATRK